MKELKPGGQLLTQRAENKNPGFMILVSESPNMFVSLQTFHCLLVRNQINPDLQEGEQLKSRKLLCC